MKKNIDIKNTSHNLTFHWIGSGAFYMTVRCFYSLKNGTPVVFRSLTDTAINLTGS